MKSRIKSCPTLMLSLVFAVTSAFAATAAFAADPLPPAKPAANPTKPAAVPAKSAAAPEKTDARSAAGPVKTAQLGSQQNRMKECNKQAKGKKGDERRAFMKSCLSTRKG